MIFSNNKIHCCDQRTSRFTAFFQLLLHLKVSLFSFCNFREKKTAVTWVFVSALSGKALSEKFKLLSRRRRWRRLQPVGAGNACGPNHKTLCSRLINLFYCPSSYPLNSESTCSFGPIYPTHAFCSSVKYAKSLLDPFSSSKLMIRGDQNKQLKIKGVKWVNKKLHQCPIDPSGVFSPNKSWCPTFIRSRVMCVGIIFIFTLCVALGVCFIMPCVIKKYKKIPSAIMKTTIMSRRESKNK